MSHPVMLYVYDLSRGMARQLSAQLTGRQIDGIWHTSVVVYSKEVYYGQGIDIAVPGRTHHGAPLQIIDMGETAIDEATFDDYIAEIRNHYTADKYHLLDFNCNSFTNDVVGFLTGGSIPTFIKDLPADFLSTPFGASLRPTIDAMFRGPSPRPGVPTSPQPQLASSLLQSVASQATAPSSSSQSLTSHLQISTNPASFKSIIASHKATVVFFTSATCGPCRAVEPLFEELAKDKAVQGGAAFVKVDIGAGLGQQVAREWNVTATPTFMFFLNGEKIAEFKGANTPELRTQVDLLLFQAFPPHPHTSLPLPTLRALSLSPILYAQPPPSVDAALSKLLTFIDEDPTPNKSSIKETFEKLVLPFLRLRVRPSPALGPPYLPPNFLVKWTSASSTLLSTLTPAHLFPLVDIWRLGVLDTRIANGLAAQQNNIPDLTQTIFQNIVSSSNPPRNLLLTTLRFATNCFCTPSLANHVLSPSTLLTSLLVSTLLHADASVRTAGASLAFNVAAERQKPLMEAARNKKPGQGELQGKDEAEEWEVEMVSALLEALGREKESEEVVHRLVASLGLLLHLSPSYSSQLAPLLDVLQARTTLKGKLKWIKKKEVRKLVEEVAEQLCPVPSS